MMPPRASPALVRRLELLTGEDGACCVGDLRAEGRILAASPRFEAALARAKLLADEKRFLALALLGQHESMCGCELQAALGLTHATVSHHMAQLAEAGLVDSQRRGKWVHYTLTPDGKEALP